MSSTELDSLFGGESDRIEYKAARPKDAKKWLKTVVAFSNSHGGSIVFGVDDKTREVVGIHPEDVFQEMDAIANAVSDAIAPTVIPSISLRQLGGKTLILVEVPEGRQVPYYLKSDGFEHGVFTRVGATSRPADLDYVREIMAENSPQGFDRMPNRDVELSDEGIAALCARMKEVALAHSHDEAEREAVRDVSKNHLLKWGILTEREGRMLPTNAYALLSGEGNEFSWRIQCGVFRGAGRSVFLDRREFDGSVIDQIEQAYQYVLSKINLGANFDHLVRRDEYEIPMWPIRELITNAVLHRSYIPHSCAQVCLYDDRLEISSPGGLKRGITLQQALSGRSESRNYALAQAFYYMRLIENWGTGLRRARDQIVDFGLREPEFLVDDDYFRVSIYRMPLEEFGEKLHPAHLDSAQAANMPSDEAVLSTGVAGTDGKPMETDGNRWGTDGEPLNQREEAIITLVRERQTVTTSDVSQLLGLGMDRSKAIVRDMVERSILVKHGNGRYTRYTLAEGE